jgi:hypothetical protein
MSATPSYFDISSVITQVMPLITVVLVMFIIISIMKELKGAF